MKRLEIFLLMTLVTMSLAAQTPETTPKPDAGPASPTPVATQSTDATVSKGDDARQEAQPPDVQAPVEQKPATAAANVSTSASASASFSALPGDVPAAKAIPAANTELQSQVQEALSRDPSLSKCNVMVAASMEGIELTGSAGSSRERLAAWRLAESYARGRRVENHIVVNGQGGSASPAPASNPAPAGATSPGGGQNNRQ